MFVVSVQVHVLPGRGEDFVHAIRENATASRKEPGNLRFDVIRSIDDTNHFILHEVYRGLEDFKSHQETPHYAKFRDAVKDWMAVARVGTKCRSIFPPDEPGRW